MSSNRHLSKDKELYRETLPLTREGLTLWAIRHSAVHYPGCDTCYKEAAIDTHATLEETLDLITYIDNWIEYWKEECPSVYSENQLDDVRTEYIIAGVSVKADYF